METKGKPLTEEVPRLGYSVDEAAAALGIGRSTLYRLIRDGRLRTLRLGRRVLITATELEGFLARASA